MLILESSYTQDQVTALAEEGKLSQCMFQALKADVSTGESLITALLTNNNYQADLMASDSPSA